MNADLKPVIVRRGRQSSQSDSTPRDVWLRLSGFLSLRSPKTQETYLGIVREWCRFLGHEPGTSACAAALLSARDIQAIAYRSWLERRPGEKPRIQRAELSSSREIAASRPGIRQRKKDGLEHTMSNATIAKKFAALRRIYRMLISSGLHPHENPFDSDVVPAPPKDSGRKRPTEMLDFSDVKRLIELADEMTPKGLRDKAILSVLFGGALRRSEAAMLRIGDVRHSSSGTLYLYLRATKAKKDARQALPAWAAATVSRLLAARRKENAADGDFLFISYTGKGGSVPTRDPITGSGIYKLFCHYCHAAGLGDSLTPHSARATAITKLLADGIPHREVQEFSRHSSIQMVELYDKRRIGVDQNPAKKLDYD